MDFESGFRVIGWCIVIVVVFAVVFAVVAGIGLGKLI